MAYKLFVRSASGFAWAGLITFIALTFLMANDINPPIFTVWLYMLASILLGIYFGVASLIFEHDDWSPLKKTVIHFCLSVIIYFTIALTVGWIPLTVWPIVFSLLVFVLIYVIFWYGFNLYYKSIANSLNESLKK